MPKQVHKLKQPNLTSDRESTVIKVLNCKITLNITLCGTLLCTLKTRSDERNFVKYYNAPIVFHLHYVYVLSYLKSLEKKLNLVDT